MAKTKKAQPSETELKFTSAILHLKNGNYKNASAHFKTLIQNTSGRHERAMAKYLQYAGFCLVKMAEDGDVEWDAVFQFYEKLEKSGKRRHLKALTSVASKYKERALWMMEKSIEAELEELEKQVARVDSELRRLHKL